MKRWIYGVCVALVLFSFSGCNVLVDKLVDIVDSAGAESGGEILSDDETVSLTVPGNWNKADDNLGEAAILGVYNGLKEQYAMVVNESKVDFADGYTLQDYFATIKQNMSGAMTDAEWTTETSTTVNGCPAIYVEVKGTAENLKIQYYINFVETANSYNQVIGWTLLSKADKNREVINGVINSFKEL